MTAGVYLHIPFCRSRCSYCDFATDIYRDGGAVQRYVEALIKEIKGFAVDEDHGPIEIDTVYFGGGTPSLLTIDQSEKILGAVRNKFNIAAGAEITIEMNPATVSAAQLLAYRDLGVNRASFGVQTFNDRALKLLARGHDATDARKTFQMLRDAGFENVSFDLIAGLPGQTMADWVANLDEAIMLWPQHISLYLLEIHEGTPLAEQVRWGRQPRPDDQLAAEMYEIMLERLATAGYEQYEISNFAKRGFGSRHNTKYWRLDPVFGFGVSAHSFDGRRRYANERDTARYVEMIEAGGSAGVTNDHLTPEQLAGEFAFLNLRLSKGLDLDEYRGRFGVDLEPRTYSALFDYSEAGLVTIDDKKIKLTTAGMLYSNDIFSLFV